MEPIDQLSLEGYYIASSILLGSNLKIVFRNEVDKNELRVLELKGIVGHLDSSSANKKLKILQIREEGSAYNLDLSMRLHKPQIQNFPEVFIFIDERCVDFCFRAVAETIEFRDWEKMDSWLP